MKIDQRALRFNCNGSSLIGVVDVPERPLLRGVLMLADSEQYRIGSHRQFTLLSRVLAQRGLPMMRFDRRGMGDSEGAPRAFDAIEDDIRAAMKEFSAQVPEMKETVILGLGDAALAAALYAPLDERVCALVLLNPLPGRPVDPAEPLRHHYLARLGEVAFWKKVARGELGLAERAGTLREQWRQMGGGSHRTALPRRIADSLHGFPGRLLLVLGGEDLAARHFARVLARHHARFRCVEVAQADHAFTSSAWRDEVAEASANWIMSW
ncbi:hydrolase 1, exosortase A system-associated [Massilia solisilvae]|uniref:Hydrolase 1, exosortase A system-associated n=1 Tax=Massilia solisilvae TaxID=1811225 RepID=A0ABT2BHQ9_9BURK|nr:hydrolase 1, exosortase A system-associated [Massilia solisilvae]MCS0608050.1 hydrolase 1, exosortase A system-associated [Massilia solisilvae]